MQPEPLETIPVEGKRISIINPVNSKDTNISPGLRRKRMSAADFNTPDKRVCFLVFITLIVRRQFFLFVGLHFTLKKLKVRRSGEKNLC